MENEKLGSRINFGVEALSFISICTILANFGENDPGDIIFMFVYESTMMIVAFAIFYIIFNSFQEIKNSKVSLYNFFKSFTTSIFSILVILVAAILFILFLNQLTVELLVAYLKDNAYKFKSIEILNTSGLYLEEETREKMENLYGKSYSIFFYITGIKYFINFSVNYFFQKDKTPKNDIFAFPGFTETASQIIVSPIAMLIACLFLVILSSIFGAQTWIVFLTLAIFRLLFLLFFKKLNRATKKI